MADAEKVKPALETLFDNMEKLIHDIMEEFLGTPSGDSKPDTTITTVPAMFSLDTTQGFLRLT